MEKTCPGCGTHAPSYAVLCKVCNFDFKAHEQPKRIPPQLGVALIVLGFAALMITRHMATSHIANRYVLDVETQSIIIAESNREGTSVNRLSFDQVKQLEHVVGGSEAKYEIVAVVRNGDRLVLKTGENSLKQSADAMATTSGIELIEVNNTRLSID